MEKIERLALLNPKTGEVSGHSLEMFRILRAMALLDWTLQHPNDLGEKAAMIKYQGLMEKTWELMNKVQGELEREPSLIEVAHG